ncbi:MAG: hypothetical protein ACRDV9_00485 [Acidimicrobiia bacterium]
MEVHASAGKHGVDEQDIRHAVEQAMVLEDQDDNTRLYLGASRSGALLEVVTVLR